MEKINEKIKVIRAPKRGHYDQETIYQILDSDFISHVGFVHDGYPVIIPTLYGRLGNYLYLHGSAASRMVKDLKKGIQISIGVTLVDGIVLARSAFHHSMNYRSVVLFGNATLVDDQDEKTAGLKALSDQVIDKRWNEVRLPNEKEMKGTTVLKIAIETASAKIRTGGPIDDKEDYELDIWAGVIPIERKYGDAIPDVLMTDKKPIPKSIEEILS